MFLRRIFTALFTFVTVAQPAAANDAFFFRYTPGTIGSISSPPPSEPGVPEEGFDVSADFVGVAGIPLTARIPAPADAHPAEWRKISGSLPAGLEMDSATGEISGSPTRKQKSSMNALAYGHDGNETARAAVRFEIFEPRAGARKLDVYAHEERGFSHPIHLPGQTVHEWIPLIPFPSWMEATSSILHGVPPEGSSGVYAFAFSGTDYLGEEVAFTYGEVTVERGPTVAFVEDVTVHPSDLIEISGKVERKIGDLSWSVEGEALPANLSFSRKYGRIRGRITTFSTSATVRLAARDSDGTVGHSNWFTVSTTDADVSLADAPDRTLTAGRHASFGFVATDVGAGAAWAVAEGTLPDGLAINASNGRISGTPASPGRHDGVVISVDGVSGSASSRPFSIHVVAQAPAAAYAPAAVRTGQDVAVAAPSVSNAEAPWHFSVADGHDTPDWMTLDPSTGAVSGMAASPGNHSLPVILTDAEGRRSGTATAGIQAYAPLAVSVAQESFTFPRLTRIDPVVPEVAENSAMPGPNDAFGSFSLSGILPEGLTFSEASGAIEGSPLAEGAFGPFSISFTDGSGETAHTGAFHIHVGPRLELEATASDIEIPAHLKVNRAGGTAQNAAGQATWELTEGTLPDGLTLGADGRIRGTTDAICLHPGIVLTASDEGGQSAATDPFSISVVPPGPISFSGTFEWAAGTPFSYRLEGESVAGVATFSAAPGSLPSGMTLAPDGTLSGTVSAPLETTATIGISDEAGRTGSGPLSIRIMPPMDMILSASHSLRRLTHAEISPQLPNAVGQPSFTVAGTLPPGMAFDPASGTVSGAPLAEGSWNGITVSATDDAGTARSATFTITVGPRNAPVLAYDFGEPLTLNSSAGLPRLPLEPTHLAGQTTFRLTGNPPAGISFNTSTGAFTGQPAQDGFFGGLTVSATDSEGMTASTAPFGIAVTDGHVFSVADQERSVRAGGYADSGPVAVGNAVAPLSFTARTALPPGFSLDGSTGALSGHPVQQGVHIVEMSVGDAAGRTRDFRLTLRVVGALSLSYAPPALNQHSVATIAPAITDAVGSPSFSLASGQLPPGMSLDAQTGEISGAPTQTGQYPVSVRVTDGGSHANEFTTPTFAIEVGQRKPLALSIPSENTVIANAPYSLAPAVTDAVGAVTWSMTGSLPAGLSFDAGAGRIHGTATSLGSWDAITLTATDAAGGSFTTDPLSFTVTTNGLPIRLTTYGVTSKPGHPFTTRVPKVSNAVGTVTFRSDDAAAFGLTLDSVTGAVSGVLTQPATLTVNVEASDSSNRIVSAPLTITVIPHLRVTMREAIDVTVSAQMNRVRPVTDYAIGSVTYELTGTLPQGLSFSTSTGGIEGTPTELGVFEGLYVRGTDSVGDTHLSEAFRITVHESGILPSVSTPNPPVLTAGATAANVTASWTPVKTGDAVSLNMPLPAGLVLDTATGRITGTPAAGSHGIHEGYVLTVTDTAGMQGFSEPFAFRIRHQDTNPFQNQTLSVRANQPFESEPHSYNADAVIGTLSFAQVSGFIASTSLDAEDGTVSGTVTSTRTFSLRPVDDIGNMNSFNVTANVIPLTVTVPAGNQIFEAGTEILTQAPAVTNAMPGATFSLTAGTVPPGLSFDTATGQFYGTMPEGSFTGLRITVTDEFGSAQSSQFSLTGADYTPDAFSFVDREGVERGAVVTDNIYLSGFSHQVPVTVTTSNGTGVFYTCSSCSAAAASWQQEGDVRMTSPGMRFWVRVTASDDYDTPVTVTATAGNTSTTWTVRTRALDVTPDPFGFQDVPVADADTVHTTGIVQITGLLDPSPVTVTGPSGSEYRICFSSNCSGTPFLPAEQATAEIVNNRYIQLRMRASEEFSTTRTMNVNVGGVEDEWNVTTRPFSDTPEPFAFDDLTELRPEGFSNISSRVHITGISQPVPVEISSDTGGSTLYWHNCAGASGSCGSLIQAGTPATIAEGRYLYVVASGPTGNGLTGTVTVKVGSRTVEWKLSTRELSLEPDDFGWTDLDNQPMGKSIQSEQISFTGIPDPVPWSWSAPPGSSVHVCTGSSCGGSHANRETLYDNNRLQLTIRTGDQPDTDYVFTVTVGTMTRTWTVRTAPADGLPDDFALEETTGAAPGTTILHGSRVHLTGVIHDASVSISGEGAEWRDCNNASGSSGCTSFTSGTRAVAPGRHIEIRARAPDENAVTSTVTLTVGGLSKDWSITTRDLHMTPDPFSFADVTGAAPGSWQRASTTRLAGVPDPVPITVSGPPSARYCWRPSNSAPAENHYCWTSEPGTVKEFDYLFVSLNAPEGADETATLSLTVGDRTVEWNVTTAP